MLLQNGKVGYIPVKFQMKFSKFSFENKSLIVGQRQKARMAGSNSSYLTKEESKFPSVSLELQLFLLPSVEYCY